MDAWISLGLCAAWFAADPVSTLNQPRPREAQPAPSSVVPASHLVIDEDSAKTIAIPPAPLPEFTDVETPQIQFEFSQPESCKDSHAILPAPPAELETAEAPRTISPRFHRYRAQISLAESQVFACGEPELESPPTPLSLTPEQLQHLRQAILHLEAAGMKDTSQELRQEARRAAAKLRQAQQRELETKEMELKQLADEVRKLKKDLMSSTDLDREADCEISSAPTPGVQNWVGIEFLADGNDSPFVAPSMTIWIPGVPSPIPNRSSTAPLLPDAWRRTFSQPIIPLSGVSDAEAAIPLPVPAPVPFHLIPSPQSSGRPHLMFPMAPMRSAENPPAKDELELPPAPLPEDADDVPVA